MVLVVWYCGLGALNSCGLEWIFGLVLSSGLL